MTKKRAIRKCIKEKWQPIAKKKGVDESDRNCILCKLYRTFGNCQKCPVFRKTRLHGCGGTPYMEWILHHRDKHDYNDCWFKVECPECEKIAKQEIAFLKSLLKGI